MPQRRFYPRSRDARAAWHANFALNLPGALATKYNITAPMLADVAADNAWMQFWVQFRNDADAQMQALVRYFNTIAGVDESAEIPAPVTWELTAGAPAEAKPGIEFRVYTIADQILGSAVYSEADGALLGIIADTPSPDSPTTVEFTLKTLASFQLEATFRLHGMDAVKFQFRYKGGNWQSAGYLVSGPGTFSVAPSVPNTAEQIEIRGVYILKNNEVGDYSDAKTAFIAP